MRYEKDENDIQDIDDLMDFYRLETGDLLELDRIIEPEEDDEETDYFDECEE